MDWQLLSLSFITVFLAEIGDKSQLAAIALSGSARSPWPVLFGSTLALVFTSFLGVIAGGSIAHWLPEVWLKGGAAAGFIILALRLLFNRKEEEA